MKCVTCARETKLGEAYALPALVRVSDVLTNLYACSRECRARWNDARQQSNQFQAELSAHAHKENLPHD